MKAQKREDSLRGSFSVAPTLQLIHKSARGLIPTHEPREGEMSQHAGGTRVMLVQGEVIDTVSFSLKAIREGVRTRLRGRPGWISAPRSIHPISGLEQTVN
jgi:hypothetical protein